MNSTSLTEARMVCVRSDTMSTFTSAGTLRTSCGSRARIASTVLMTLAPACLNTKSSTCLPAALIASSTSTAAASMLRDRSNCSVICELPMTFTDVICASPGIWPNWVSSGVAMVAGLAPG